MFTPYSLPAPTTTPAAPLTAAPLTASIATDTNKVIGAGVVIATCVGAMIYAAKNINDDENSSDNDEISLKTKSSKKHVRIVDEYDTTNIPIKKGDMPMRKKKRGNEPIEPTESDEDELSISSVFSSLFGIDE